MKDSPFNQFRRRLPDDDGAGWGSAVESESPKSDKSFGMFDIETASEKMQRLKHAAKTDEEVAAIEQKEEEHQFNLQRMQDYKDGKLAEKLAKQERSAARAAQAKPPIATSSSSSDNTMLIVGGVIVLLLIYNS